MPDKIRSDFNYSIAFMKAVFSFCVICAHYYISQDPGFYPSAALGRMAGAAAPVFFIISIFLTFNKLKEKDPTLLGKRVWRLYYPQFVWGILYFIVYTIIGMILNKIRINNDFYILFTKKDLMWQVLTGSDRYLCPQFWFQFDLIVFTLLFWLIIRATEKHALKILMILGVIALILQYSGLNYRMFCRLEYELWYPIGRLMEILPFCVAGAVLTSLDLIGIIRAYRIRSLIISLCTLIFAILCPFIPELRHGFDYGGIRLILYSVSVFTLLLSIPFDKLNEPLKKCLKFLSKYSFGVFCIHMGIGRIWECIICKVTGWSTGTVAECLLIYLISLIAAWLISLIPTRSSRSLVT